MEIGITQCRSGGIDCRVHLLGVTGHKRELLPDPWGSHAFLALDEDDLSVSFLSMTIDNTVLMAWKFC